MKEAAFLVTKRLKLYPLSVDFCSDQYLTWLNDAEVNHYSYRRFFPTTKKALLDYLNSVENKQDDLAFAIVLNRGRHIGNISLHSIDWQSRFAELGIIIGEKDCWGKGFALEAIRKILEYAFVRLNLHRIEIGTYNPAAVRVFEKAGFQHEGISRSKIFIDGNYHDDVRMAILVDEYLNTL